MDSDCFKEWAVALPVEHMTIPNQSQEARAQGMIVLTEYSTGELGFTFSGVSDDNLF